MNETAAPVASEIDEFALAGLTSMPRLIVKAPRVRESRAATECKVIDIIKYKDQHGRKVDGWMVLGEVVAVHNDKSLIENEVCQTAKAFPILRAG